ncbi:MAG: acyltransferase [Breznakibacter sp.]
MILQNIVVGQKVDVDDATSINNVDLADGVTIGKRCTVFGREGQLLKIGRYSTVGMNTILNGYSAQLTIGDYCSIGPNCHFIVDSGPTASPRLLVKYPIGAAPITVGDHCHVGASCMVIAGVTIGECAVVEPNSFVNRDVPPYSVYGGSPAKFIRDVEIP